MPTWLAAFGFWTLVAAASATSSLLTRIGEGEAINIRRELAWTLPIFYLWMLLAPAVMALGRRTADLARGRFLAIHVPLSLTIAAVHAPCSLFIYWMLRGDPLPGAVRMDTSYGHLLRVDFIYLFHLSVLTYWIVLFVSRGLDSRRRLRDVQLRTATLETQLAQSELRALRAQLQPHFLFNTLNAISALALEDPLAARAMIARLAELLRLTLEEGGAQEVPLSRELQFVECYLALQRVRFQDRLAVHMDVSHETLTATVPYLILQPLVENAFRHGLARKSGRRSLRLSTRREGEELLLSVEDDGVGLATGPVVEGVGLGNTRARLRARFGDAARIALDPRPGGGARAEVRLPFVEAAEAVEAAS
jgi:two-component system, LytTR family, sensor kinase